MKTLVALFVLFVGISMSSVHGQLMNFDFTITSQSYYDYANYSSYTIPETYTLSGEIVGLQNNSSSAPEDILIFNTAFPDGGGLNGFVQNPYSLVAHGFTETGQFTVSNGTIIGTTSGGVSYNFRSNGTSQDIWDNFYFNAASQADGTNGASGIVGVNGQNGGSNLGSNNPGIYGGEEAYNTNGFSGATYTLVATPEPSSWALGLSSIGFFVLLRFRPSKIGFPTCFSPLEQPGSR